MTQQQLKPGRELDVRIATEVMGLQDVELRDHGMAVPDFSYLVEETGYFRDVPFYSTDIAAAWKVIEELSRKGWHIGLSTATGTGWYVTLKSDEARIVEFSESAPHAICLAARKAMGVL